MTDKTTQAEVTQADEDSSWFLIATDGKKNTIILDYAPWWKQFDVEFYWEDTFQSDPPSDLAPGAYLWTGFTLGHWDEDSGINATGGTFEPHRLSQPPTASTSDVREAAQAVVDRATRTYKARNGRTMSIEADDGEACEIVHSDDMHHLRVALSAHPAPGMVEPQPASNDAVREALVLAREWMEHRDHCECLQCEPASSALTCDCGFIGAADQVKAALTPPPAADGQTGVDRTGEGLREAAVAEAWSAYMDEAVSNAPEPLRKLGEYLASLLDEDQWKTAERYLNAAVLSSPLGSVTVETDYSRFQHDRAKAFEWLLDSLIADRAVTYERHGDLHKIRHRALSTTPAPTSGDEGLVEAEADGWERGMRDAANICGSLAETTYDDSDAFEAATGCEAAIISDLRSHQRNRSRPPANEVAPANGGEGA